jgi:hypothetical protein
MLSSRDALPLDDPLITGELEALGKLPEWRESTRATMSNITYRYAVGLSGWVELEILALPEGETEEEERARLKRITDVIREKLPEAQENVLKGVLDAFRATFMASPEVQAVIGKDARRLVFDGSEYGLVMTESTRWEQAKLPVRYIKFAYPLSPDWWETMDSDTREQIIADCRVRAIEPIIVACENRFAVLGHDRPEFRQLLYPDSDVRPKWG